MPITLSGDLLHIKNGNTYTSANTMINGSISEVNAARDNGVAAVNSTASAKTAEINARVNELTSAASTNKEISDMFAEAFSASKSYTAGEYVIYTTNGVNKLYQFTVNHAAGAWKGSADTKEVTVAGSVSDFAANLVKGQNTEPTDPNTRIWIDTDSTKSVVVPQIDDNNVSTTDTWSSSKIKGEDDGIREEVTEIKSAFDECFDVTKSNNLINPAEIVRGTIDTDGQPKESTTFRRTDEFIPVIPGETYSFRRLVNIYTYNSNKQFVEKLAVGTSAQTRTLGNNAYYIKATSNVDPSVYRWLLNQGSTLIDEDWTPDTIKLAEEVGISYQIDGTLTEAGKAADAKATGDNLRKLLSTSPYNHGPFITKSEDYDNYYVNSLQDFSTEEFDGSTTYDYVVSKFDDLMTLDTGFVAKNSLGLASDGTSTIYEYVIQPHHYIGTNTPISPYCERKIPVILCNASIHGFEKNSTYALYFFLKDLLTNWKTNPALAAIRSNICFKAIPVSNPYGFNNDIYYNANNVNINRNFDTPGWESITGSDDQNSGLEPFDQPESRIIRDWVNANKSNSLMFYDIHTNGHYYTTGYNNFNALLARFYADVADDYFKRLANVFTRHIERQTIKLPTIYQTLTPANNEYLGRYQENRTVYGTASTWATYNGALSMTFEMFNGLNIEGTGHVLSLFTADAKKCCSELLGNIIAEVIMEYSDN